MWAIPMDIAPKYSGTASGLMNSGSALAAILSPVVAGAVTDWTGDPQLPFVIAIGVLMLGALSSFLMHPERQFTGRGDADGQAERGAGGISLKNIHGIDSNDHQTEGRCVWIWRACAAGTPRFGGGSAPDSFPPFQSRFPELQFGVSERQSLSPELPTCRLQFYRPHIRTEWRLCAGPSRRSSLRPDRAASTSESPTTMCAIKPSPRRRSKAHRAPRRGTRLRFKEKTKLRTARLLPAKEHEKSRKYCWREIQSSRADDLIKITLTL